MKKVMFLIGVCVVLGGLFVCNTLFACAGSGTEREAYSAEVPATGDFTGQFYVALHECQYKETKDDIDYFSKSIMYPETSYHCVYISGSTRSCTHDYEIGHNYWWLFPNAGCAPGTPVDYDDNEGNIHWDRDSAGNGAPE